ncbi:hypothetical protein Tco_1563236 [Tanacetum coccineum]
MGERVCRGEKGRRPREDNDERVNDLNGQGNDQGLGANGGVEGVNGNVEGVNRGVGGAPDFSTIIAQQLQNLLPVMLAQVGNQGNVGNQNGNVVNENVQENVGNVLVNGNWVVGLMAVVGWRVKESDGGDRIDPVVRNIFGVGRKSHRKTFPVDGGGRRQGGGWPTEASKGEGGKGGAWRRMSMGIG